MKSVIVFYSILILFACSSAKGQTEDENLLYVWVDSLRMRQEPSLKSKTITVLRKNKVVEYLKQKSAKPVTVRLRDRYFIDYFYKVRTKNKLTGWVYGGAVNHGKPLDNAVKKNHMSRINLYIAVINRLWKRIKHTKFKNSRRDLLSGFTTSGVSTVIFGKKGKPSQVGNPSYTFYFKEGIKEQAINDGYICYYTGNFPLLTNGLKPGMPKQAVIKILGSPVYSKAGIMVYYKTGDMSVGMDQTIFLYFREGVLFGIRVSYMNGC